MLKQIILLSVSFLMGTVVDADIPAITNIHAEPAEIIVKTPTSVIFMARIASDASHIPDTVRLLRLQWSGNVRQIAKMNDDGSNGDQKAGDGIYTATIKLKEPIIGLLSFSIDVKYKATRTPPIRSQAIFVNVTGGEK